MHNLHLRFSLFVVIISCILLSSNGVFGRGCAANSGNLLARSGDAYVRQEGTRWCFGTSKVEKEVGLSDGHLSLLSFKNSLTGHEYVQGSSDVFRFVLDGQEVSGRNQNWVLAGRNTETLPQGQLLFRLIIRNGDVEVTKNYLIYPAESVIQEWLRIKNISGHSLTLENPSFLQMHILQREVSQIDFSYMTGGMCFYGSWILKTLPLTSAYARNFDASDPAECLPGKPCPKGWAMGNSIYAPIQIYFDRKSKDGVFVGWDYLGKWASSVGNYHGGPINVNLRVSGYKQTLPASAEVTTPRAFTGVFERDLDNMGNQLLDYQYRYKWDYTREGYFPAIRMLGYWWKGAGYWPPSSGQPVDFRSTFLKIFRTVDLMRYVGADIYWRDYGWWDLAGDWNGPDFNETRRYLAKYGMKQTIYTIVYDAEQGSRVVENHPDWMLYKGGEFGGQYVLDQSKPGVVNFELGILDRQEREWGNFEWRKDDSPLYAVNGDYTPMLAQDHNFRRLLKRYLDRYPGSAFHGCDGGGNDLGYEVLRMASVWQYTDGCVGRYRDYYASYLFPPDKLENQPDNWDPNNYDKSTWRGLLWSSFPMTGDTFNPAKLEGIRQLIDIYHYLAKEGVVGRWVKVYHPNVTGDFPTWYLQRMSRDNLRGIIIPAHSPYTPATIYHGGGNYSLGKIGNPVVSKAVTIYPKGLLPDATYDVSFQESSATTKRSGRDLMAKGITFEKMKPGELIYLNLPMHPGSTADKIPPTAPQQVTKRFGTNMGYIGIELTWNPGTDNNWISYYQIYRNGYPLDKVAKGTYYFDHSLGADLAARYEVATVDGSGNTSDKAVAYGLAPAADQIIDDASAELKYTGKGWKHEHNVWAVFKGTQSLTHEAKDAVEYKFDGNRITWYGRLGSAMGKADVYIDDKLDQTVDAYDADEIPNMALYTRTFPSKGVHMIRIVATGDHDWRSSGDWIVIDGLQVGEAKAKVVDDAPGNGIEYGGAGWKHGGGWNQAVAKTITWTGHPGDSATYTFHGDGITWVGKMCPACGRADVYVDNVLETTVDTYSPDIHRYHLDRQGGWQVPVFDKSWTRSGSHTVRIVVRPDKSEESTGYEIYVDSFQVSGH